MKRDANNCGKVDYASRVEAELVLSRITRQEAPKKIGRLTPGRAYQCGRCGGWHLTSQRRMGERDGQP